MVRLNNGVGIGVPEIGVPSMKAGASYLFGMGHCQLLG
jgi:hypothetical protein